MKLRNFSADQVVILSRNPAGPTCVAISRVFSDPFPQGLVRREPLLIGGQASIPPPRCSMSTFTVPPPKERLPGPMPAKRRCSECECFLSRNNPSERCAPCGGWPRKRMIHGLDDLYEVLEG